MMDFIMNNMETIGMLLVAIIMAVWAVFTRQWSVLQVMAYKFMLSAERLMRTKEGKVKMEFVFSQIWMQIPKWLKKFVTEETLREKLQEWYNTAKDSLIKTT